MTVREAHRMLGRLIDEGHGRTPLCINKRTFTNPLEGDGCVIMPVESIEVQVIDQMDGDGFLKTRRNGNTVSTLTCVLQGNDTAPANLECPACGGTGTTGVVAEGGQAEPCPSCTPQPPLEREQQSQCPSCKRVFARIGERVSECPYCRVFIPAST